MARFQSKGREGRRMGDVIVSVRDGSGVEHWMCDLARRYGIAEEPARKETAIFFDTFDGRLFDKGLACSQTGTSVRLFSLETAGKEAREVVNPFPRFAAQLPDGELRAHLLPVAKNRALLEVLRTSTDRRTWRILNSDQKTVARVVLEQIEAWDDSRSESLGPFVFLEPVRGYERIAADIERWIDQRGYKRVEGPVYGHALEALHESAKRVPSRIRLKESMAAAEAVRVLLESFYETVRVNETGVLNDTDTEFLHDYRVAVRKARSLAGQMRGVFAPEPTAQFRKSLSWLARSTNALRDLDVYLEHRTKYQSWLTSPFDEAIDPLFLYVEGARQEAFDGLVIVMNSQEYRDALSGWRAFVQDLGLSGLGRKGEEPIGRVARARIAKKCRQVLERGYQVSGTTAPDALHRLRIECKHLRYLIESFAEFVRGSKPVIRRLKKLQDTLGAIQDLTVQEQRLQQYLEGLEIRKERPNTLAATQELIARVREERNLEQGRVRKRFARFSESLAESDPPYAVLLPWLRRV